MILVTGATGTNGKLLIERLSQSGQSVRALVRDEAKAASLRGPQVELATGELLDAASLDAALSGVDKAFLLVPADERMVEMQRAFVDAAKRAGVRRIVKLSAGGADASSPVAFARWHGEGEQIVEASGIAWTHLRPNAFMQNLLGSAGSIAGEGRFYQPGGNASISHVDARDVAAVAERVLTEDGHEGRAYTLTGPQALTFTQVADELSQATGKTVSYVDITPEQFKSALTGYGLPERMADAMNELYGVFRAGYASGVTTDIADVTGREATPLSRFARDHASAFSGAA